VPGAPVNPALVPADDLAAVVAAQLVTLPDWVRRVLPYEIGHALGLGEERLRELGED